MDVASPEKGDLYKVLGQQRKYFFIQKCNVCNSVPQCMAMMTSGLGGSKDGLRGKKIHSLILEHPGLSLSKDLCHQPSWQNLQKL